METKREKFIRLAESRTNNTLKQIELLSNLSNKRAYEYEIADIEQIVKILRSAVNDLEHTFKIDKVTQKFKLK